MFNFWPSITLKDYWSKYVGWSVPTGGFLKFKHKHQIWLSCNYESFKFSQQGSRCIDLIYLHPNLMYIFTNVIVQNLNGQISIGARNCFDVEVNIPIDPHASTKT